MTFSQHAFLAWPFKAGRGKAATSLKRPVESFSGHLVKTGYVPSLTAEEMARSHKHPQLPSTPWGVEEVQNLTGLGG